MTIRPRAVRALRDVRERLRDAAAATHASASAARDASQVALVEEQQELTRHVDDAAQVLGSARTVYDLERYDEDTGVHRLAILEAQKKRDQADAASQVTAQSLRDSTRKLRSAEKLVEHVQNTRERAASVAEQRANDDMAGRRFR
jgi:flagellar biosynthesis chaperone FliJ